MPLLTKAVNQTAFLKAAIYGKQGAGKTHTAIELATGLAKLTKNNKIAFFDTETGSDYHINRLKQAGLELFVIKTKSFLDLCNTIKEAEKEKFGALIVDSVTHVWVELQDSYMKKLGRSRLQIQDWMSLKKEWRTFTELYVNSKLHIVLCGRSGDEYTFTENEDTGRKEMIKTGTKMKAEAEMGYESSLLLEMERISQSKETQDLDAKGTINRCHVLKDRTDTMNGKQIDYPKFKDFKSHIDFLNLGGEHVGVDSTRNSEEMFDSPDKSFTQKMKQVDIALEEVSIALTKLGLDGHGAETKKQRIALLEEVFGTSNKVQIESLPLNILQTGVKALHGRTKNSDGQDSGKEKV